MKGLCLLPVRDAEQQGGICPCSICPFGGGANITMPSFDDVLSAFSFLPGWRQGVFLPSSILWIFFSVFLPTNCLSSCAYSILFFLASWPVNKGGTLCSSLPAAVPVLVDGHYLSQVLLLGHTCGKAVRSFWAGQP